MRETIVPNSVMLPGARELTVLGEFRPFGMIVEALDSKPFDDVADHYDCFLFHPRTIGEDPDSDPDASASGHCEHELFIRGNRNVAFHGEEVGNPFHVPSVARCPHSTYDEESHRENQARVEDLTIVSCCIVEIIISKHSYQRDQGNGQAALHLLTEKYQRSISQGLDNGIDVAWKKVPDNPKLQLSVQQSTE